MFKLFTLCSGGLHLSYARKLRIYERWDPHSRTLKYLGDLHEDFQFLKAWDLKGLLTKASPFNQLKGRSSQPHPPRGLQEAGPPVGFPPLAASWPGLLPALAARWASLSNSEYSLGSGHRGLLSSGARALGKSETAGKISEPESRKTIAKPCVFPLALLAVLQWGRPASR